MNILFFIALALKLESAFCVKKEFWTFSNVYSMDVMNFRPELLELNLTVSPFWDNRFVSGTLEVKEEMSDSYKWEVLLLNNGMEEQKTFRFPESTATNFNKQYWEKHFRKHLKTCTKFSQWKAVGKYTFSECMIPNFTIKFEDFRIIPNKRQRVIFKVTKNGELVHKTVATLMGKLTIETQPGYYYFYNFDTKKFQTF